MKKLIAWMLSLGLVLTLAACGDSIDPGQTKEPFASNGVQETQPSETEKAESPVQSGKLTVEEVMNHPVAPESDFECIEDGNGGVVLWRYVGTDDIVVIPETWNGNPIVAVNPYVFGVVSNVRGIKLSDSVTLVDESSCGMNVNLEIFICGSGLLELGEGVFQGCESLREVILNDGLVKLGGISLGCCDSLERVYIPETVTDIHDTAFYGCMDGFVLEGKSGSPIEAYAEEAGIDFEAK